MENSTICKHDPKIGNYLVAAKGFKPGDVIVRESPALVGPNHSKVPVCLECCSLEPERKCPNCDWAICSECARKEDSVKIWHTTEECEMLRGKQALYEAIFPLRLVNEARKGSEIWHQLNRLQSHVDKKLNSPDWLVFHEKIIPFIMESLVMPSLSKDLVAQCFGIICVNAISFDVKNRKGRGLYSLASLASHQCTMNAIHSISPINLWLSFKASKPIRQNEEITISYVPLIVGEPLRTEHIESEWNFHCNCHRCSNQCILSSIKCQNCSEGTLQYETQGAEKLSKPWTCSSCNYQMEAKMVIEVIQAAQSGLKSLLHSSSPNCGQIEDFLSRQNKVLGQSHFLRLIAQRNQITLNKTLDLDEKLRICEDMLKVIKRIGGKYTEWSGFLYNELARGYAQLFKKATTVDESRIFGAMSRGYSLEAKKCHDILS